MSKHLTSQRFVYKIHSSRLRRSKWDLKLTIDKAKENKELIALSESQVMRFIDEIRNTENSEENISNLKHQISLLKQEINLSVSRPQIRKLYNKLNEYQFKKDYVCVIIDNEKDYYRIYKKGFKINGREYRRLLGTTGGIKTNTIVFVSADIVDELKKRINNGRDLTKQFSPAKLEAYNALVCSSSIPVSLPHGVLVVHDCITHFKADVIKLDDTNVDEPIMQFIKDNDIELNESDGYGLAMPNLMERWGKEIGEDYILPGCVIRNAFCKGAVFPIDFQQFALDHNLKTITDVWGNEHNIFNIELVLTESMLKLWDSYSSIDDYLKKCQENHYTFAITKTSEKELENVRTMNYQFLQSYDFTDEQINELIKPTINEIKDILGGDYKKTILYTKGVGLNEKNVKHLDNSFATALMIEPKMIFDPYIRSQINSMIQKRIDAAKVGSLKVEANYSFVSGDPYSLCQSMFGLEVTGLLKPGEVYSKYWIDKKIDTIVSFRAPMTSHNNIRKLKVAHNPVMDEFYKYMTTPTIFNSWDTCADAMNGFDKDGDCVINTSNKILVENTKELPAIICVQRKAPKCIPTEDDLMRSNIISFGNDVGFTTNKVTTMFEVQARFPKDSEEYKILDYRIKCGQLYQQNAIDKSKGIDAKPMPDKWYSWIANRIDPKDKKGNPIEISLEEIETRIRNRKMLADIKPYFMKYVYPAEKTKYNDYIKKNNEKALMRFRKTLDELLNTKESDLSDEESHFITCYKSRIPLGTAPCTINKICTKIESIFDNNELENFDKEFDYTILKNEVEYSKQLYNKIKIKYESYKERIMGFMKLVKKERIKQEDRIASKYIIDSSFKQECYEICPNEKMLANIVLDLCYTKSKNSKQFAWDMCGDVFIKTLLEKNNYKFYYPTADKNGDIEFNGMYFSMKEINVTPKLENY